MFLSFVCLLLKLSEFSIFQSFRISIFDHSCDPSANYRFVGKEIYVKAMKNINCDDIRDVRIAYIELLAPTEERQQLLAENYYFKCRCERCLDDYD